MTHLFQNELSMAFTTPKVKCKTVGPALVQLRLCRSQRHTDLLLLGLLGDREGPFQAVLSCGHRRASLHLSRSGAVPSHLLVSTCARQNQHRLCS